MTHPFPKPDFRAYNCTAKIDYVTIVSDSPFPLATLRSHGIKVPPWPPKPFARGKLATLHDPRPRSLEALQKLCPGARLRTLEVALDFRPRHPASKTELRRQLRQMFQYLISRIYPWGGPGLQKAARISGGKDHADILVDRSWAPFEKGDAIEGTRLPRLDETVYFGHGSAKWADPAQPQFAYVRVYCKVADGSAELPPNEWRIRLEVNLNQAGCEHFGLRDLAELTTFRFRDLRPYLQLVEPAVVVRASKRSIKAMPWLEAAMRHASEVATRQMHEHGAYLAIAEPGALTGRGHLCREGNRKIGALLGCLSSSFTRYTLRRSD